MQVGQGCWVVSVNRRVGGLEDTRELGISIQNVNRRVGGLEAAERAPCNPDMVNRRVGGLEDHRTSYSVQTLC